MAGLCALLVRQVPGVRQPFERQISPLAERQVVADYCPIALMSHIGAHRRLRSHADAGKLHVNCGPCMLVRASHVRTEGCWTTTKIAVQRDQLCSLLGCTASLTR
jgi:hypothetical protein